MRTDIMHGVPLNLKFDISLTAQTVDRTLLQSNVWCLCHNSLATSAHDRDKISGILSRIEVLHSRTHADRRSESMVQVFCQRHVDW